MRQPLLVILPLFLLTALPSIGAAAAISFPQIAKLKAADGAAGDEFGYAVAVSGDFVIVGAQGDDDLDSRSGSAYVFDRNAGGADAWGQVAKLTAPGGDAVGIFGNSVAISGERAIVGAPADLEAVGHAYVFERGVGGPDAWGVVATLVPTDSAVGDSFGTSIAMDGDLAVVGGDLADGPGSSVNGAAYLFERDAGGPDAWGQVAKLTAAIACEDDASLCGWRNDDFFGSSVAISGDTIVVGTSDSSGFAYIFRRHEEGSWRRVGRPIPVDFSGGNHYGTVALTGGTVLVGAYGDDDLGAQAGAAYVFEPDPGGPRPWADTVKLTVPAGSEGDWFGWSVAVSGETAVIGAPQIEQDWRGEAYVLRRDAGGANAWGAVAHLLAADGEDYDIFGHAVAISGETVIAGAYGDDDLGTEAGAAYIFQATHEDPPLALSQAELSRLAPGADLAAEGAGALQRSLAAAPVPVSELDTEAPLLGSELAVGRPAVLAQTAIEAPEAAAPSGAQARGRAQAPGETRLCLDFDNYCDALELTVSGGTVRGVWRAPAEFFCEPFEVAISGSLAGGRVLLRCDALEDPCPVGASWGWILDLPLDGTLDMLQLDGLWNAWIDETPYTTSAGPCPF